MKFVLQGAHWEKDLLHDLAPDYRYKTLTMLDANKSTQKISGKFVSPFLMQLIHYYSFVNFLTLSECLFNEYSFISDISLRTIS